MDYTLTHKPLKTYSKIPDITPKTTQKRCYKTRITVVVKREPLTTKKAVELLLNGTLKKQVCRYCMNVTNVLNDLDQIMQISGKCALYKVSIRDMVAAFHPFKVVDDPNFPNKICEKCLSETTRLYLFAQQCERSERALRNCFDDMYEKLEKLDPLEHTKKRGRQKQNPNRNILYTENKYVIDYADPIHNLINSGTVPLTNELMMNELECKRCWQVLPNLESLVNHEKIHPKTMWYNCRLCGRSFSKKFHMKKHLRSHNKNVEEISESEKAFECKECGRISEDYQTHLQHIEKHKFGRVLQHLLKRKMDDLCSVCLDNRSQMMDLDKTICLHGGYPELTGERSLFHILGATVPELKRKYKYQDLYVPYQANIMTITNKNKDEKLYLKENYIISGPTILSYEKKEYDKMYLFIFAKPLVNLEGAITDDVDDVDNEFITSNGIRNVETSNNTNNQSEKENLNDKTSYNNYNVGVNGHKLGEIPIEIDTTFIGHEKQINLPAVDNIKIAFSKPDNVIGDVNKSSSSLIETTINQVKQCKVCWIFKKPTCKNCVTAGNIENEGNFNHRSELTVSENCTDKKTCKFCWIFKNKNCDICNNLSQTNISLPKILNSMASELEVTGKKIKFDRKLIITGKANPNNIITGKGNKSLKRKIAEDAYAGTFSAKKSKWQCNICLTVNKTNRETCICCEHYILNTDTEVSNFNWGHCKVFASNFGQKMVKNISISERLVSNTIVELEVNYIGNQVNHKQEDSLEKHVNEEMQTDIIEKLPVVEDMEITENVVTTIHSITNVWQTLGKNINNNNIHQAHDFSALTFHNEDMDLSEDISKELHLTKQFNIGKGPQEEKKYLRRFKKPLRRNSHK